MIGETQKFKFTDEKVMKQENRVKNNNIGISLLKIIMSFCVVLIHYWSDTNHSRILIPFEKIKGYAVPVFMFLSFYLTQKSFLNRDPDYIKKRLFRLLWPQLGWTVIYFSVYSIINLITLEVNSNTNFHIYDYIWQLFTGHSSEINAAMWYQMVIVIISVAFIYLFKFASIKTGLMVINILMIISFYFQYSEINYVFFRDLRFELKYPLGRLCEMIPYAALGLTVSYFNILEKCERLKLLVLICLFVFTGFFMEYEWRFLPGGFGYQGIQRLCIAFGIVSIIALLPLEKIPVWVKRVVQSLSRYTLGIYCMHNMIGRFLKSFFENNGLESGTFLMCVFIWIICYIIAFVVSTIPIKLCRQLVE